MRPRILVTLDTGTTERRGVPFDSIHTKTAYARAVERAGGTPILASPTEDEEVIDALFSTADGIVVTGGDFDIDPTLFGEDATTGVRVDAPKPLRTAFEWKLTALAFEDRIPILGICGGMQLMNVVLGGTLHLHVDGHEQPTSPRDPAHGVTLTVGRIAALTGESTLAVNTTHHQAVAQLGSGLVSEGVAPDGVIEAIAHDKHPFAVGVQWHPELLDDEVSDRLYEGLVEAAAKRAEQRDREA